MSVCSDRSCASSMMITLYLGGREERRLLAEFVVHHGFAQQHSVGDELDVGVGTRAVVETDAVTDPRSSATRFATVMAATRRGCVIPITPSLLLRGWMRMNWNSPDS